MLRLELRYLAPSVPPPIAPFPKEELKLWTLSLPLDDFLLPSFWLPRYCWWFSDDPNPYSSRTCWWMLDCWDWLPPAPFLVPFPFPTQQDSPFPSDTTAVSPVECRMHWHSSVPMHLDADSSFLHSHFHDRLLEQLQMWVLWTRSWIDCSMRWGWSFRIWTPWGRVESGSNWSSLTMISSWARNGSQVPALISRYCSRPLIVRLKIRSCWSTDWWRLKRMADVVRMAEVLVAVARSRRRGEHPVQSDW